MADGVQVALVLVLPPMELEKVQRLNVHAAQRPFDVLFHQSPAHWAGLGHPFGEGLNVGPLLSPAAGFQPAPELANNVFSRSVVVGQVPGGEPRVQVGEHALDGCFRVDSAVGARHLPHAVQEAGHL